MRNNDVHFWDTMKALKIYSDEMKNLSLLYDKAPKREKNKILDKMTALLNRAMGETERAHGRRFTPIKLRFS